MTKYSDGLDALATALAHRGRRQVVTRLSSGPSTSTLLAGELGVTLPTLHQHLRVLSSADLIVSRKVGRVVTHRLRPEPLGEMTDWLAARRSFWGRQLDALDNHLAEEEGDDA